MHRAGYKTVAACEVIDWRRVLYAQNNPGVLIYDDVRTLTVDRLRRDLGRLPGIIVGSPPCQDISSANTKGRGVDGEQSGLFFEAVRIIGECRPRWFALENSANLRTRGADRVLAALEAIGYACWTFVVGAGNVGANHERKRAWIIGFNIAQLAHAQKDGCLARSGLSRSSRGDQSQNDVSDASNDRRPAGWPWGRSLATAGISIPACGDADATRLGHDGGRPWRHGPNGNGSPSVASGDASDTVVERQSRIVGGDDRRGQAKVEHPCFIAGQSFAHADREGRPHGAEHAEMGWSTGADDLVGEPWADWNGGLAASLRLDDGLSAWLAQSRIAIGGPRGASGASLVVEAFGDAVLPQIPEAIGRAVWRVEQQLLLRVSP